MNKTLSVFLSPHNQCDIECKGAKIMEVYAPGGAIT